MRINKKKLLKNVAINSLISLILVLVGVIYIWISERNLKKKYGRGGDSEDY